MWTKLGKFGVFIAISVFGAGCVSQPNAQVTTRNVSAVAAGGPAEVWVVMGERGADVSKNGVVINKDSYALYHCIPQGCKRVSELAGNRVTTR
ncbi:MAG: hypothetical protein HS104_02270 [Polyangiaceae bacterium]|nr:hypothetical protein [Polyangiaceae bacterium]MBK8996944.1 hypothetical protein [Myxococcales bacterium]MBK9002257.1 hypothetical protein [Myxococcales bacterium]